MQSICFHCHLDVPENAPWQLSYQGKQHALCCPGCLAVAELIIQQGLGHFYQTREAPNITQKDKSQHIAAQLALLDDPEFQQKFIHEERSLGTIEAPLIIEGLTCSACVWLIERHLMQQDGVQQVALALSTQRARIIFDPKKIALSEIIVHLEKLGYQATPYQTSTLAKKLSKQHQGFMMRLGASGLGMMQVMMFAVGLYFGFFLGIETEYANMIRWASFTVTTPILIFCGLPFFNSAIRIIRAKSLNMDVPVCIALTASYLLSIWSLIYQGQEVYFDTIVMFLFFLTLSRFLEHQAQYQASFALPIDKMIPIFAHCKDGNEYQETPLDNLQKGDTILVRAGETVPADGHIIEGESGFNESMLTGESMPVLKRKLDTILAGTQNIESAVVIQVDKIGKDTQFATITRLMEKSQHEKPTSVITANRFAKYFVGFVLIFSALGFYLGFKTSLTQGFETFLAVLVITCPCALSLATPTALTVAMTTMARKGFLIIKSHVCDTLTHLSDIIFDKTGTLTENKLRITQVLTDENTDAHAMSVAKTLEQHSNHPIAMAIVDITKQAPTCALKRITSHASQGVEGFDEEYTYRIGQPPYVQDICQSTLSAPQQRGKWIVLANNNTSLAWFEYKEKIRHDAKVTIEQCQLLGLDVHMLSGDPSSEANAFAENLNISKAQTNFSFEEKSQYLKKLQTQAATVAVVGDGINDAMMLQNANLSIAMNVASDLTKTKADVILINNELNAIVHAINIMKFTHRIIRQNISWAIGYNLIALPLALTGWVPPYLAALGMSFSSLIVVFNALRIKRHGLRG